MPLRVSLIALNAAGLSGVPRYTGVLSRALAQVSHEFPGLDLRLVATPAGAEAIAQDRLRTQIVHPLGLDLGRGAARLVVEQALIPFLGSDLVHYFDVYGPLLSPRRPFTVTFHDASICYRTLAHFGRFQRVYKEHLYPWALRRAARIVAVSSFAKQEAVERFQVDPKKVEVVPSGPGFVPARDAASRANGRRPYLLFVGNLTRSKNVPFLVRAYERADVDADLVLAGRMADGTNEIVDLISHSPLRRRIEILAAPDDATVDRLYRGALALLHPSRYEGFGFTPLEAMARGCPVLASDIPAIREVSGEGAMLVPLDETAWVERIRRLVGDAALRDDLRSRGLDTAAKYSWETTARALCRLFVRTGERGNRG